MAPLRKAPTVEYAARVAEMPFGGFLVSTSLPSPDDSHRLTGVVWPGPWSDSEPVSRRPVLCYLVCRAIDD